MSDDMEFQGKHPQLLARRSFLKLSGLLGLGTLASVMLPAEHAEALLFKHKEYKVSKTRLAMGTFVAMTAIHSSRDQAEDAFGLAFEEVDRLTRLLSRHSEESPVAELNRAGVLNESPVELREVLTRSLYYHRATGGTFDITVKPLVDLYQVCAKNGRNPAEDEIDKVLQSVGSSGVQVDGSTVRFKKEQMGVTLDGIAKGYIVDRVSQVLLKNGLHNHLINAGGDIRTSGAAANGAPWTVAIQDPLKRREYPDTIAMKDGAIATSGNYEVFYDQEKLFHHIVDSRSGLSPQLSTSVSLVAPTVMEADALSTAVFVLEPQKGVAFINSRPGCECFIIDRAGKITRSSGWYS